MCGNHVQFNGRRRMQNDVKNLTGSHVCCVYGWVSVFTLLQGLILPAGVLFYCKTPFQDIVSNLPLQTPSLQIPITSSITKAVKASL